MAHRAVRAAIRAGAEPGAIRRLLASCGLPTADLTGELAPRFLGAFDGETLAGVVGLEIYEEAGLLRSLAVDPRYRGGRPGRPAARRGGGMRPRGGGGRALPPHDDGRALLSFPGIPPGPAGGGTAGDSGDERVFLPLPAGRRLPRQGAFRARSLRLTTAWAASRSSCAERPDCSRISRTQGSAESSTA